MTQSFDIICLNSVCHHFDDATLISLLKKINQQARLAVVLINDLQRHWINYIVFKIMSIPLRFSSLTRQDGALSVLRAFSKSDWIYLLKEAGIQHYQLRWVWPFRWEIINPLKRNISVIFAINYQE